MTFDEAQSCYRALREQRRTGVLDEATFFTAVNALRVQDTAHRWWQPDPQAEGWLCWDGAAWHAATPPLPSTSPHPSTPDAPTTPIAETLDPTLSRLHIPTVTADSFWAIARRTPWAKRPESWWNALSIFGGIASGYLWFVYGSVSGFPQLNMRIPTLFLGLPRFIPPLLLLLAPLLLLLARQQSSGLLSQIAHRLGKLGLLTKILLLAVPVVGYYLLPRFPAIMNHLNMGEGLDFITPVLMLALPLLFIAFRAPIDFLLGPVQRLRKSFPPLLVLGIGCAVPFLTAFILYQFFHLNEYPLLRVNLLVGSFLSYLIVRTPQLRKPLSPAATTLVNLCGLLSLAALWALSAAPACADDFLRDPFNFNDGLRTDGIGPILAGIPAATITLLVNGVEVVRTVLQGVAAPEDGGEDAEHVNYSVIVDTKDAAGITSTDVTDDLQQPLFLFAHCEQEGRPFPAGDSTITMTVTSNADWVSAVAEAGTRSRCWRLQVPTPLPVTPQPETADLIVSAGGGLVSAPITLRVVVHPRMVVEAKNWQVADEFARAYKVYENDPFSEESLLSFDEIKIYFVKANDPTIIVKPDYQPESWIIRAEPDYLDFDTPEPDESGMIWYAAVTPKPELQFDDDWLAANGVIEVHVEMHAIFPE